MALWGGRFKSGLDPDMEEFNASLKFDKRMYKEDIVGSQVYAQALKDVKLITGRFHQFSFFKSNFFFIKQFLMNTFLIAILIADEETQIVDGLNVVLNEWNENRFAIKNDEDIHTANERRLKELIGSEIGGKLHTGIRKDD